MFTEDIHSLENLYYKNTNNLVNNLGKEPSAELNLQY